MACLVGRCDGADVVAVRRTVIRTQHGRSLGPRLGGSGALNPERATRHPETSPYRVQFCAELDRRQLQPLLLP